MEYTRYNKTPTDKEDQAVLLWSVGKAAKQIAHETGLSLRMVYEIRHRFPLLCFGRKAQDASDE